MEAKSTSPVMDDKRNPLVHAQFFEQCVQVAAVLDTEKFEARATVVESAEGDRLGSIQLQKLPALAELQAKITRKVPVVLLERKK